MPESDLDLLIRAARAAADIAIPLQHSGTLDVQHKAGNAGPVTRADLAVNAMLAEELRSARTDYGWLSEESTDTPDRLVQDRCFIIDPIDGTRSFIEGSGTWAHSLAIAEKGVVIAGVVLLPASNKLYTAVLGQGAFLNGAAIQVTDQAQLNTAEILTTKPNIAPEHWRHDVPAFRRHHRPSLAYRLCLVAEGRFDGMFTFRPSWEWDIAAGTLIATEAGATASDKTGATLRFNTADALTNGVITAPAQLHGDITRQLVAAT